MDDRKIDERTFDFALLVVDVYKFLLVKKEFVLSKQLLRSGTSVGANVSEAQAAQSRNDFISKKAQETQNDPQIRLPLRGTSGQVTQINAD